MEQMSGGCQCGRVRFTAEVEPEQAYACHCAMCRKATGGVWAALINVAMRSIKWNGKPDWHQSSDIAHRAFCSHCGTPLGFAYLEDMERVDLTIGSFDDPGPFRPTRNYGAEGMLPAWTDLSHLPSQRTEDNPEMMRRWREASMEAVR